MRHRLRVGEAMAKAPQQGVDPTHPVGHTRQGDSILTGIAGQRVRPCEGLVQPLIDERQQTLIAAQIARLRDRDPGIARPKGGDVFADLVDQSPAEEKIRDDHDSFRTRACDEFRRFHEGRPRNPDKTRQDPPHMAALGKQARDFAEICIGIRIT